MSAVVRGAGERSDVWLTPAWLIDALGGASSFHLDPCAPAQQPWPTALHTYTEAQDGLALPFFGRVWLNPPYSVRLLSAFMRRLADHDRGTALVFARTDTRAFFESVWDRATGLLFVRGRLRFHTPDGLLAPKDGGAPSVLVAYGQEDAEILAASAIDGRFVPLRLPRAWLVELEGPSWRAVVGGFFEGREGPVALDELYRAIAHHPKARRNRHYRDKVRQVLQEGAYVNVSRGVWASA